MLSTTYISSVRISEFVYFFSNICVGANAINDLRKLRHVCAQ